MKIKLLLLSCMLGLCHMVGGQNLVRNPGFESYTPGVSGTYLEDMVHNWFAYYTTPDYFSLDIWDNALMMDYCGTLPRSGQAMAGGYQLGFFPHLPAYNREFLQGELSEPLKANTLYYAEMYVKPMVKSPIISWGVSSMGMAFTNRHYETIAVTDTFMIPEIPEVEYNGPVITERNEWTKISGCFTAEGGETKIIIGNFRKDRATDIALIPGAIQDGPYNMSYYLFDDLLVKEMPAAYINPAEALICKDSNVLLTAFPEGMQYRWSTGAASRTITASKAGAYTVDILTPEGCTLKATANVTVKHCGPVCPKLYMPNAFSPNGDGNNDHFRPMNGEDITGISLSIYSRWGQRVYYSNSLNAKWDGHFSDRPCDAGTYFYQVDYRDCHGESKTGKGSLTLIR